MDEIAQLTALDVFLKNQEEAKAYLAQYGDEGIDRNQGVTLSYIQLAQSDPLFVWFTAAALGSYQVGETIALADKPVLNNCQSTQTLSLGFAWGNQAIHNNIVALYYTYQDIGLDGLNELKDIDKKGKYISDPAMQAFSIYSDLAAQAIEYANQNGFMPNDLNVIKNILSKPENLAALKEASMQLVQHEQAIVEPMYQLSFFEGGQTVAEVLNDTSYLENLIANGLEIAGAKILDTYIPVGNHNLSSYDERLSYFGEVFDEYFNILSQVNGFDKILGQRNVMQLDLGETYFAYGHEPINHFAHQIESLSSTLPKQASFTVDLTDFNIGLAHMTKDDLRNSPDYVHTYQSGIVFYGGTALPWMAQNSQIIEINDKFYYYTMSGINRGLTFPMFYDMTTNTPLGLALDERGVFDEKNGVDVLVNTPELFSNPGHISQNMGFVSAQIQFNIISSSFTMQGLALDAISSHMNEIHVLKIKDVLDQNGSSLPSLYDVSTNKDGFASPNSPGSGHIKVENHMIDTCDQVSYQHHPDLPGSPMLLNINICYDYG